MRADCERRARGLVFAGVLAFGLAAAPSVHAFCLATTCDVQNDDCPVDAHGCVTVGKPLFWPDACLAVWMPSDAQPLPGIDASTLAALTQTAFDTWRDAECASGMPALEAHVAGELECIAPDFRKGKPDGFSVVTVDADEWPHPGKPNEVALTTLGFIPSSGEIRGFVIELNAVDHDFSTSDRVTDVDLLGALTHEAGHALGLAHSDVASATMFPTTDHDTALRTLDRDDERAICSVYPPDPDGQSACEGDHVATDAEATCDAVAGRAAALTRAPSGCSCDSAGAPHAATGFAWLLLIVALSRARFRRARAGGCRARACAS